jgi:hypothetical protein
MEGRCKVIPAPQDTWPNCSPDRFREICGELAAIYTAIHAGKRIVWRDRDNERWKDITQGPTVACIFSGRKFAIYAEEPETVWAIRSASDPGLFHLTSEKTVSDGWLNDGLSVMVFKCAHRTFRSGIPVSDTTAQQP